MTQTLTASTPLLDYRDPAIERLVADRGWAEFALHDRIGAVYDFVRNEIDFGYNTDDNIAASVVLADGYGQCNTKSTLLMALLRSVDVECRFHAATIHKELQKGVVRGVWYRLTPAEILHSWVEVRVGDHWRRLEGVILDEEYLDGLRCQFGGGPFLGFGAGTDDLANPNNEWRGGDTEIQMTGVARDLGVFDSPDEFYSSAGTNLSGIKGVVYRHLGRRVMNRRVARIRRRAL